MKYLVYGRGFAAYGYVPALASMGREVFVPLDLFKKLNPDQFCHPDDLYNVKLFRPSNVKVDAVVLAVRPLEISPRISALDSLLLRGIHLLLEKPVGVSPQKSIALFDELALRGVMPFVNYSFLWTNWHSKIKNLLYVGTEIHCEWRFRSRFDIKKEAWKTKHEQGGGALLFYAIHFIALFPDSQCRNVIYCNLSNNGQSDNNLECELELMDTKRNKRQTLKIFLNSASEKTSFSIRVDNQVVCEQSDPFDFTGSGSTSSRLLVDRRISVLQRYIRLTENASWHPILLKIARSAQEKLIVISRSFKIDGRR